MDETPLTDWYHSGQKPMRVGVYSASYKPHLYAIMPTYKYWDGARWGFAHNTVDGAYENRSAATNDAHQDWAWRGIRHMGSTRVYIDRVGRNWSRHTTEHGVRWAMHAGGRKYYIMVAYEMLADPCGRKLAADWIRQTRAVLRDMVARHGV